MKRLSLIFLSMLLFAASAFSRPAYPGTARVQQPDGTFVTIRLVGDEYRSFNTTTDGYTLTRDARGYYVYAQLDADGRLAPTTFVAREPAERTVQEQEYLRSVGPRLTPRMSEAQSTFQRRNRASQSQALAQRRAAYYDYSKFRGLVILVEFNDCPFRYDDYADIMDHMINDDDYTGDSRTRVDSQPCTGSVRDFFRDNSSGTFLPHFDVVGPVKINRSQYYPRPDGTQESNNYEQLMKDAARAADDLVNFKDYDVDGDGTVDMVYFIFSGLGSYVTGNDKRLLWPHQSDLSYSYFRRDGVYLGRYACSVELLGSEDWGVLDGIGTICHEFSHVLGLPDFYDTNNVNEEACVNPGLWSVMANGADYNYGRTPCNFSLYERYALGFAMPQVIDEAGQFSIEAIHQSNAGYRINTPVKREYFLLENRQREKWDAELPGHGMLIFRVDSTNTQPWYWNTVNDNPAHPYYELVRAKGVSASSNDPSPSTSRDPFPGTGRVYHISNTTKPANLLSWAGKECDFALRNIAESWGVISFEAYYAHVLTGIVLPDSITLGYATFTQLTPVMVPDNARATLTWTSDNPAVATVDATGLVTAVSEGTCNITATATTPGASAATIPGASAATIPGASAPGITATCVVTVKKQDIAPDIAAFRAIDEGQSAQLSLIDAQVLWAHSDDLYVRDASGSMRISGTGLQATANDLLDGPLFGRLEHVNRMPQLSPVTNATSIDAITVSTAAEAAQPREVLHSDDLTDDMLCDLIVLRGATMTLENKMIFAHVGNTQARVFNTFQLKGITMPKTTQLDGRYFDIVGILTTEVLGDSVSYVISFTGPIVEVDKPYSGPVVGDVNNDGTVDVADISAIISVMAGATLPDASAATIPGASAAGRADVNGDGSVDVADISTVISIMAE